MDNKFGLGPVPTKTQMLERLTDKFIFLPMQPKFLADVGRAWHDSVDGLEVDSLRTPHDQLRAPLGLPQGYPLQLAGEQTPYRGGRHLLLLGHKLISNLASCQPIFLCLECFHCLLGA